MTEHVRIYDNSMLSDFKRCPRFFYYRHELGWAPDRKAAALVFGTAWHAAMETVWGYFTAAQKGQKLNKVQIATDAHGTFCAVWAQEGMPPASEWSYDLEEEFKPRTPGRALEMLLAYVDTRMKVLHEMEVVSMERPFAVPLDPTDDSLFYVGKIDKIVKRHSKLVGIEHKTSSQYSKTGVFRSAFVDSFSPNAQVDGYLYALHLMFPGKVGGVWVDASLVHREVEGFLFIPVERRLDQLESWLWEVRWWINQVEGQRSALAEVAEHDKVMRSFPKNTNSCNDFNTPCQYIELCKSWTNPLGKPLPLGYKVERWSPLAHIKGLSDPRSVNLADLKVV